MKYRPSTSFIICLVSTLAVGGVAGWAWSKANSVPEHKRVSMSFFDALRYQEKKQRGFEPPTPEQLAAVRPQAIELKQRMLAEFPDLAVPGRSVPDDQNGFRLLYELANGSEWLVSGVNMPVTAELRNLLSDKEPWDPVAMRAALEANRDLIAKIEHIAALPQRSSENMPADYNGFIPARDIKTCSDIMMARARLAAEAKDEAEALRLVTVTLNLACHYDQVETPSLLAATIGILVDLQVQDSVLTKLLPALGREADVTGWRAVIVSRPDYTVDRFADLMRGEWNITGEYFILPILLSPSTKDRPEDYEQLFRAYTGRFDAFSKMIRGQEASILLKLPSMPSTQIELSAKSREWLDLLCTGNEGWAKGYARASSLRARTLVALDLLIMEKSGTTLHADSISQTIREPLSGEAFPFDPSTRTISAPPAIAGEVEMKPLTLPW